MYFKTASSCLWEESKFGKDRREVMNHTSKRLYWRSWVVKLSLNRWQVLSRNSLQISTSYFPSSYPNYCENSASLFWLSCSIQFSKISIGIWTVLLTDIWQAIPSTWHLHIVYQTCCQPQPQSRFMILALTQALKNFLKKAIEMLGNEIKRQIMVILIEHSEKWKWCWNNKVRCYLKEK